MQNCWGVNKVYYGNVKVARIDLIHDTRHLCTRSRIDGLKPMSRGISGGKQVIKFANTSNHCRVCLFYHFIVIQFIHIGSWQDLRHYCLP